MSSNWDPYKKQRNFCTSLRRRAIVNHKADNASSKPKDFWKVFGSLFHFAKRGQANDIVLEENTEYICDKQHIADLFNEYYVNTVRPLQPPIKQPPRAPFLHSLI